MVLKVKSARVVLLAMFIAYTTAWSYITIMRYLAMNANVFDLGLFMEYGWWVLHEVHTFYSFLYWFSYNGIIYVVSPITLLESYPAVLIFQSALIGFAVFPLYGIAKYYLKDELSSLLIAASYLLYFPLAGVNWFDAHYQALFPTLFLLGYYFYLNKKLVPSLIFFLLSSMIRYPYFVFPTLFALIVLIGQIKERNIRKVEFATTIIAFGVLLTVIFYTVYSHGAYVQNFVGTVRLGVGTPSGLLNLKLNTFALFLFPLLLLPLLSKRWILFYVPFFYLVATTTFWGYIYPNVFMLQYPAGIVPFLFLGTVDAIALLSGARVRRSRVISAMLLITVVIFAVAYEPYGPLNAKSGIDYNFEQQTRASISLYDQMNRMIALINSSDPYVLFQSNIPQVLPRPLEYVRTPLITNMREVTYNFMHIYPNGTSVPVRVDYVLSDPYSSWYYFKQSPPFNASMYDFIRELYASTNFGLLAEASGMMLLERNYSGGVKYFVPLNQNFSDSQMLSSINQHDFNYTDFNSNTYTIAWYGPYTNLYPGIYRVTYWLYTTNSNNSLLLQITANDGSTVLVSKLVEPGTLKAYKWNEYNLTFYSNEIYSAVEFRGLISKWNGTLLFKGVSLEQIAPGLPNAHDIYVFPDELYAGPGAKVSNDVLTVFNASNTIAWYGPYVNLYPGTYIAKYSLSTTNSSPYNRAMLQVTADNGKVILGEQGITGADLNNMSYEIFTVNSTTQNVEFKGYVQRWNGNLSLYSIRVMTAKPIFNVTYPAYGLYSNLYANGDIILNANNTFFYGPYVNLPAGNYSVTFILQGQAELNLQVTSNFGSDYLAEKTVSVNGLSIVTINFSISSEAQYVEFRGYLIKGSAELRAILLN